MAEKKNSKFQSPGKIKNPEKNTPKPQTACKSMFGQISP